MRGKGREAKNWRPFRGRSEGVDDANRRESRRIVVAKVFFHLGLIRFLGILLAFFVDFTGGWMVVR